MKNFLLQSLYYLALIYPMFVGLSALLSIFSPTHIINKKYWGFLISGILGLVICIYSYISNNHITVLLALILPYVILKMCGGEPDLDPSK